MVFPSQRCARQLRSTRRRPARGVRRRVITERTARRQRPFGVLIGLLGIRRPPAAFARCASAPKVAIVLFDIDGTLVRTGGAGSRAMNRAFEDVFGIAGAFDGIPMAGRTDKRILEDAVARADVDLGPPFL